MTEESKEDPMVESDHGVRQEAGNDSYEDGQDHDIKQDNNEILLSLKEQTLLLKDIQEKIQNRLEFDEIKEKAFNKLYEEMKRQQNMFELSDKAVKPILTDLILLFDNFKKFEASLINETEDEEERLQHFRFLMEQLIEILYRQEVNIIEENVSNTFNSKIQKAVKTEKTESKEDDFKIERVVRNGFTWRDKILRSQEVVVRRFVG